MKGRASQLFSSSWMVNNFNSGVFGMKENIFLENVNLKTKLVSNLISHDLLVCKTLLKKLFLEHRW